HFVGADLERTFDASLLIPRLLEKGVVISPYTGVSCIEGNKVVLYNVYSEKERTIENVDIVVLAMSKKSNDELYFALKGKVKELYRIGDCVAPRKIDKAIYEGNKVGRML
ncbi:mycofactocin system FadH/OYE family oxidoreductase 2, partial [Chloroflexota bacterium]